MSARALVGDGVRNALAGEPRIDRALIESTLRRANRSVGRELGAIEWSGSFGAYLRTRAGLIAEWWTVDGTAPLNPGSNVREFRSTLPAPADAEAFRAVERVLELEGRLLAVEATEDDTS